MSSASLSPAIFYLLWLMLDIYDNITIATHKALVLRSRHQPLILETIPSPRAKAGEVVILVLCRYS